MKNNSGTNSSITLKQDQLRRLHFMQMVIDGHMTLREASEKMGVSYRQAKRLKQSYAMRGVNGIVHGNMGRKSPRAISDDIKRKILHLVQSRYSALSDTRITEKVCAELDIDISRETVRKILRTGGIKSSRSVDTLLGSRAHQSAGQEGRMVLWGRMTGQWLTANQGKCCFMAAVDAATHKCLAARLVPVESSFGYLWLLKKVLLSFGVPGAFCQHSQNTMIQRDSIWTINEELRGERDPSQVGRALRMLGVPQYLESRRRVTSISSLFSNFLEEELERLQPLTLQRANRLLETKLIHLFNRRFCLANSSAEKAWRPVPRSLDPERVCSFYYDANVLWNNKVILGDIEIDIPPGQKRISYAKAPVEVRQLLNGFWRVYYADEIIATHDPTPVREPVVSKGMKGHNLGLSNAFWIYELYAQGEME